MLQNHFKIAFRHLTRSKVFTAINVLGLAMGMVAFFFIVQYVSFEMSFDQFHENKNEIYRVAYKQYENGEVKNTSAMNFAGIRRLLKENFPEVDETTGFSPMPNNLGFLFGYKGKKFLEAGKYLRADSNFFKVFPSLLVRGDKDLALKDPHNLVISEKIARKIFGDQDPIGQFIDNLEGKKLDHYVVSGVMKDIPENSHFHADFANKIDKEWDNDSGVWNDPGFYNYFTTKPKTNSKAVESKLNQILQKLEQEKKVPKGATSVIQPITDIHFNSHLEAELEANGNATLVYIILVVGILIIVIAWINYVNIETARFISRVSEISVRRIVGSGKWNLAAQFLVEYFCLNCVAIALACIGSFALLPYFGSLTGMPASLVSSNQTLWLSAFLFFVAGSSVTGVLPVLFFLRLNPIESLKGKLGGLGKREAVRTSLVTFQFITSISLIAFLLVITDQLEFLRSSNKNLTIDQVVSIRNPTAYAGATDFTVTENEYDALENKLKQNHAIKLVSGSSAIPGTEVGFTFVNLLKRSLTDPFSPVRYKMLFIDDGFIPMYGLKLKAGRNFSLQNGEDVDIQTKQWNNQSVPKDYFLTLLLNESAVHALGFKSNEEAINQIIYLQLWADDFERYKIVGIVEDYNHQSVKTLVQPTIFTFNFKKFQMVYYSIKLNAGSKPKDALSYIEKIWKEIFPDKPFDYFFLDEYYDRQFKSELHFSRIFSVFSGVAMFIAFVGILGMTLFEANARLKEISIRKVLGATVANLMLLLSQKYFKLIVVATLIASPLIYFSAKSWLQTYPVRVDISPVFFVLPIVALLAVVGLASGFQTFKAANANPVDHLKNE